MRKTKPAAPPAPARDPGEVHLRHLTREGRTFVSEHYAWNARGFVARRHAAAAEAALLPKAKQSPVDVIQVQQLTLAQYRQAKGWRKRR